MKFQHKDKWECFAWFPVLVDSFWCKERRGGAFEWYVWFETYWKWRRTSGIVTCHPTRPNLYEDD